MYVRIMGAIIEVSHSKLAITATSGQVLAANLNRKYALLANDSDTTIYLGLGVTAVAGEGIPLNPHGGSYEMSSAIGNLYTGVINAIHSGTGNKNLLITEGV